MKTNIILGFGIVLLFIFPIFFTAPTAGTKEKRITPLTTYTNKGSNISFYCHGFSDSNLISSKYLPPIWFVKDFSLKIFFEMRFLRYNRFIFWNETGILTKGIADHTMFTATNYTGCIIHRRWVLGYVWNLYGQCSNYTLHGPY